MFFKIIAAVLELRVKVYIFDSKIDLTSKIRDSQIWSEDNFFGGWCILYTF